MKRFFCIWLALLCLSLSAALSEDGIYPLAEQITLLENEELFLTREDSYFSGDIVYKGNTRLELPGACVLHSAAVVMSNLLGEPITAQQAASANNKGFYPDKSWTSSVVWGRLSSQFSVKFDYENLSEQRARLRSRGVKKEARAAWMLEHLRQQLELCGDTVGLILHFNSTGQRGGDGRMHTVTLMGYIERDGRLRDLVVNDCNIPAPQGVCVRLCDSTLPHSMLGDKKCAKLTDEEIIIALMECVVSCRWVSRK